jgi:hypothetical protein
MSSAPSLFAVLVEAKALHDSEKYHQGQRYELIVLVQETSMDKALAIARGAIAKALWAEPEFNEITRVTGKMSLAKLRRLNVEKGVAAAVKHGQAVIVFPEPT